jgi:hypothetical protein
LDSVFSDSQKRIPSHSTEDHEQAIPSWNFRLSPSGKYVAYFIKQLIQRVSATAQLLVAFAFYYPTTLFSIYLILVLSGYFRWVFRTGWHYEWFQLATWVTHHDRLVYAILLLPLSALFCWHQLAKQFEFKPKYQFKQSVRHGYLHAGIITFTTIGVMALSGQIFFSRLIPVSASHGCSDAVNITTGTTWSTNQCHGAVTVTNGATLTINGGIVANLTSLTLGDGVTNGFITAKGDTTNDIGVVINLDSDFHNYSGSNISADSQGYPGSYQGPGAGNGSTGGGHGGQGASSFPYTTSAGTTYDSVSAPVNLGSSSDLAGGGAIKIKVGGNATVDGNITAAGACNGGGSVCGAGGSVWLDFTGTSTLSGGGSITAAGGANANTPAGGGGGRVAITGYTTNTESGTIRANGGSGQSGKNGAAGTVFTKSTAETNGTLISDNASVAPQEPRSTGTGNLTVDTLTIQNSGVITSSTSNVITATTVTISSSGQLHPLADTTLTTVTVNSTGKISHPANVATETYKMANLTITDLTINSGGSVNVDSKGYTTANSGPGGGDASTAGGHGGAGSTTISTNHATSFGGIYDSVTQPSNIGSSGGGAGGGTVKLTVSGNLVNDGTITANGGNGSLTPGGAGGSIWIAFTGGSSTLSGGGSISAVGGANNSSSGAGGGLIAITGYTSNTMAGTILAYGGSGTSNSIVGANGTVFTKSTSETNGTLTVDNNNQTPQEERKTGANVTVDTLTIKNKGQITFTSGNIVTATTTTINTSGRLLPMVTAATLTTVTVQTTGVISHWANGASESYTIPGLTIGTLTIDSGGSVNLDNKGYVTTNSGPGAGNSNTGGGHGGMGSTGSNAVTTTTGGTYDSVTAPVNIGSSGSKAGAGAVKLTITGNLVNDGTITANGQGSAVAELCGAGGAVWINFTGGSSTLSGGGSISANGGSSNSSGGHGGGGGRIAITGHTSNSMSGAISTYGGTGTGGNNGAPGTVYTKSTAETNGTLTLNNNGNDQLADRYTEIGTTATFDTFTRSNHANNLGIKSGGNVTFPSFTFNFPLRNRGTISLPTPLTIASGGNLVADAATTLGTVTLNSGGKISHTFNTTAETYEANVTATAITINSGGSIDVSSDGYSGGASGAAGGGSSTGKGALGGASSGGGGGGHGGNGGSGQGGAGGAGGSTYDSQTNPVNIGSGGGGGANGAGGAGGGALILNVTNLLSVSGTINANGAVGTNSSFGGGGGSGGTINITATDLTCSNGAITANGGNGQGSTASGGGGGGGRILFTLSGTKNCIGTVATGGTGGSGGSAGTVYQPVNTPGSFAASNITTTSIQWNWTDQSTTETAFHLQDASHGAIATINSTTTAGTGSSYNYNETGLAVNTQYTRHVHGYDGVADSASSSPAIVYTLANTPGTPTLSNITNTSMKLVMDVNSNPTGGGFTDTEFAIFESSTNKYVQADGTLNTSAVWQTYTNWGGATGKTITGLSVDTPYTFAVKARNGDGTETALSSTAVNYTLANTPSAPSISTITTNSLLIRINQNGNSGFTKYEIYESNTNQFVQTDGTLNTSAVWQTYVQWDNGFGKSITGLTPGATYVFSMKARNGDSTETSFSATTSADMLAAVPGAPTLTGITTSSITVIIIPNGNTSTVEFAIYESTTNKYVQADGTLGASAIWQTYTTWGGGSGQVVSGLTGSTTYTFAVKARNATPTESALSSSTSAITADNAPSNFSATNITTASITWSWVDQSTTETSFHLHDAAHTVIATINSTTTGTTGTTYTYFDQSLSPNVSYTRHVHSYDGSNDSDASTQVSAYTLANTPDAPTLSNATTSSIKFVVNPNGNPPATEFAVFSSVDSKYVQADGTLGASPVWQTYTNWGGASGTTITGLGPNIVNNIVVKARNGNNTETAFSATSSLDTLANTPSAPTLSNVGAINLTLKVNENSNPSSTEYAIFESSTGKYVQSDGTLGASAVWRTFLQWGGNSGITVSGLTPNTLYGFSVKARNGDHVETALSTEATTTTLSSVPGIPTITASTTTSHTVVINENGNPAGTEYAIHESTLGKYVQANGTLGASTIWQTFTNWGGGSGIVVTGLSVNTNYSFEIKSRDGNQVETAFSSAASAFTLANNPGSATINPAAQNIVFIINQNGNPSGTQYAIHEATNDQFVQTGGNLAFAPIVWQTYAQWGSGSGISVTGLTPNTHYNFQIKARNGNNVETSYTANLIVTYANTPGTPTLTNVTNTSITVNISKNSNSDPTEYKIFESTTNQYVQADGSLGVGIVWQTYANWGGVAGRTVNGLSVNTSYSFSTTARNDDAVETTSSGFASGFTQSNTPGQPTLSDITTTSIRVTILQSSNPSTTQYAIFDTISAKYVQANGTFGAGTVWQTYGAWGGSSGQVISGLSVNVQYNIAVKARNGDNSETALSAASPAYTLANTPSVPTLSNVSETSVTVTVAPNGNPAATQFAIHDSIHDKFVQADGSLGNSAIWQNYAQWGGSSGVSVTGLTPGESYHFEVKARNGDNVETAYSTTTSTATLANVPGVPTISGATTGGFTITIDQNSNSSSAEYAIYESTTNKYAQADGSFGASAVWQTYTNWGGTSGQAISGLNVNTQYTFQVKARNADAVETSLSSSASAYTLANVPASPTLANITTTSATLTIAVNSNPASTEFAIFESDTNTYVQADGTLGAAVAWQNNANWGGTSGKQISGLTPASSYSFAMKARNGDNVETALSGATTITTTATPVSGGTSTPNPTPGPAPSSSSTPSPTPNAPLTTGSSEPSAEASPSVNQPSGPLSQVIASISNALTSIVQTIGSLATTVVQAIASLVSSLGNTLNSLIVALSNTVSTVVASINQSIAAVVEPVIASISTAIQNIETAFATGNQSVGDILTTLANELSTGARIIIASAEVVINPLVTLFKEAASSGVTIIGYTTATTLSLASPALALFGSIGDSLAQAFGVSTRAFGVNTSTGFNVVSWRKKGAKKWGKVGSSVSLKGIPGVSVALYDVKNYNRIVDRTLTDNQGEYGFLAEPGVYKIAVSHPKFHFPSKFLGDGYRGESIELSSDGVVDKNIMLDPNPLPSRFIGAKDTLIYLSETLRRPMLILGVMFTLYNLSHGISLVQGFYVAYYFALVVMEVVHVKESHNVLTATDSEGNPVGFAVLRIIDKEGKMVFSKATTSHGKALVRVPQGIYTLEVIPPSVEPNLKALKMPLNLTKGLSAKSLTIKLDGIVTQSAIHPHGAENFKSGNTLDAPPLATSLASTASITANVQAPAQSTESAWHVRLTHFLEKIRAAFRLILAGIDAIFEVLSHTNYLIMLIINIIKMQIAALFGIHSTTPTWGIVSLPGSNQPLAFAMVTLYNGQGKVTARALTDKSGHYGFKVAPGRYQVRIEKPGYSFLNRMNRFGYIIVPSEGTPQLDLYGDQPTTDTWLAGNDSQS